MRNLIFFLFLIPFCNLAHEYKDSNIVIKHPVLKLISKDSNTAAGYLSIENNSSKEIIFKGIISDIAKTQEIHEVILKNNVYKIVKKNLFILILILQRKVINRYIYSWLNLCSYA